MPLSEQEQRLLEEMERSLYQNDADFVAAVHPRSGKTNYTVLVGGILLAVLGIATLVTGVIVRQPLVGVLGFVIMFVGVLLAVAPPRRMTEHASRAGSGKAGSGKTGTSGSSASSKPRTSGFMDNLNERWDKRSEGGN